MATARIRDYRPADKGALDYVCLKTGDSGGDGEPFYQDDPDALGRIYVEPYLAFEPDLALVLEVDDVVSGYVLGALDSRRFYNRYEREWRPKLCQQFPLPTGDENSWSRVEQVYYLYHHPDYFLPERYDEYPSHLHIDLLPQRQGQGHGRPMVESLLERLKQHGSPGLHLQLSGRNSRAYGFYTALGLQELSRQGTGNDESICMGIKFVGF
jgi:ribosomal protein S18 acetylase RimI-like enzyme